MIFFSAEQHRRWVKLMERCYLARDKGASLPGDEQAELESLAAAEEGLAFVGDVERTPRQFAIQETLGNVGAQRPGRVEAALRADASGHPDHGGSY